MTKVGETTAPDGRPVAFHDLPESSFPFTMTAYGPDGEIVWRKTIDGPGVLEIPGTGPGSVKRVEVKYADGRVEAHDEGDE